VDFDEMNSFLSTHKRGDQDVKSRIRKRGLESRERRLLGTLSGVYGFDLFFFCVAALGGFMDHSLPYSVNITLAVGCVAVALVFAYAIYRIWRDPPPPPISVAIPGLILTIIGLFGAWILFLLNAVALISLYSLSKTWKELAAMSEKSSEIRTPPVSATN